MKRLALYDGNGIEKIEWSPTGTRLLVEVSQWTWGTDSTWNTKYIVVTPATGEMRELPTVAAIQKHFAKPCVRLVSSTGWIDDERIGIEVKPDKDVDEEGKARATPSCVGEPTRFSFDVDSGDFLNWRQISISNNVGGVKGFSEHTSACTRRRAPSRSRCSLRFPTWARFLIVGVKNSVRPSHLFDLDRDHDYLFELPCCGERDAQSLRR